VHESPHRIPSHDAVAFAPPAHGWHEPPHVATSLLLTHVFPHAWKPVRHWKPQLTPLHVGAAFATAGHGEHEPPHVAGFMLLTHALPHAWKPAWHWKRQLPTSQLDVPLGTSGQLVLHPPQWVGDVCGSTHWFPHSVGAFGAQPVVHVKPAAVGAQFGAPAPHTALHVPQWVASERSVSHPLLALPSQSA
jgi:hypothetical protein